MLVKADRDLVEVIQFFAARGLEAGYLVPTKAGLEEDGIDAHFQLSSYLRRTGLHDFSTQGTGGGAKVILGAWCLGRDGFVQTYASLYRQETKNGGPRIGINDLGTYAAPGNLLAVFAHAGELYVVNASANGLLDSARDPSSPFSRMLDLLAAAKNKPLDDRFSEWNLRLLRSFFSEASRGEEVFLRVDSDLLEQIGQDIGGDRGFLEAVRAGAPWLGQDNIVRCVQALVSQRKLRSTNYKDPGEFDVTYRGLFAPTYLPYLAALVRNDAEAHAYYPGLQKDLELRHPFGPAEMEQVEQAWGDLQEWTNRLHGRFGYFKLRRLGGYRRIGIPRSQSILKPGDVEDLARVFVQAEVRPGQDVDDRALSRILEEARAAPGHFSAAFQKALDIPEFEQPIRAAIAATYLDWDGTLPAKGTGTRSAQPANGREGVDGTEATLGLALVVEHAEPLTLAPRWRLPAIQDVGMFEISTARFSWHGNSTGTDGANTVSSAGSTDEIWRAAESAFAMEQKFGLTLHGAGDSEPTKRGIVLAQRRLWMLVPVFDDVTGSIELQEGDLPGSGQAYLLAPPRNSSQLKAYLTREAPAHEIVVTNGLPEGWLLACLLDCAALDSAQRLLPDGEDGAHPKPRAIRFIGGRAVRRGYSRLYLPYDLPTIQLDAPFGTRVSCADGVAVEDEAGDGARLGAGMTAFTPMRRFKIRLPHSRSASYEIRAVLNGQVIGQAKLRVSGLSGDIVELGHPFSIDHLGAPIPSEEGLSGVLLPSSLDERPRARIAPFEVEPSALGRELGEDAQAPGARELFLDSLAQSGGLDYGVARDMLRRLLSSTGEVGEPPFILLELRSRGHLEISTTPRGHIARVHATSPALYNLSVNCSGREVWAVAGTLRLAQWASLAQERQSWAVYRRGESAKGRGQWRLLVKNDDEASASCARLALRRAPWPCAAIAEWSADLHLVREETFRHTMESIGHARDGAMCFNGSKGKFTMTATGRPCELLKVRDLDTGVDNMYVLANESRYAFVRDSRWGVWIALDAFAKWANDLPGMSGVHPMPITYAATDKTVWLPARISLPSLLERALVLCSGGPPEVIVLTKAGRTSAGDRINLSNQGSLPCVTVNGVYEDMASGKWLAYRWVSECVAKTVAGKLGAALDVV